MGKHKVVYFIFKIDSDEIYRLDYYSSRERSFYERLGVADLFLLKRVVKKNYEVFTKNKQPVRHNSFVVAVLKDMENLGYKTRLNEILEFPVYRIKRNLDGD